MIPNIPSIQNPERYKDFALSREKLEYALKETLKKVDYMMDDFPVDRFPSEASKGQVYGKEEDIMHADVVSTDDAGTFGEFVFESPYLHAEE